MSGMTVERRELVELLARGVRRLLALPNKSGGRASVVDSTSLSVGRTFANPLVIVPGALELSRQTSVTGDVG